MPLVSSPLALEHCPICIIYLRIINFRSYIRGRPGGVVIKLAGLALAAWGLLVQILGVPECAAHQATLWQHPKEELEGLTTRINYVLGLWGGKKKNEEDW